MKVFVLMLFMSVVLAAGNAGYYSPGISMSNRGVSVPLNDSSLIAVRHRNMSTATYDLEWKNGLVWEIRLDTIWGWTARRHLVYDDIGGLNDSMYPPRDSVWTEWRLYVTQYDGDSVRTFRVGNLQEVAR